MKNTKKRGSTSNETADKKRKPDGVVIMGTHLLLEDNKLDAGDSRLTVLPAEIVELRSLKVLYLYENKLAKLPSEIGNLIALKKLDLNYNRLISIPPEIGNLSALKYLNLGNNLLTSLLYFSSSSTLYAYFFRRGNHV